MPKHGHLPVDYYGSSFGWTASNEVTRWFDEAYKKYKADNALKLQAFETFHGLGANKFKYRTNGLTSSRP